MANQNPTHGQRSVPFDLPFAQVAILRGKLGRWLAGVRDDLATPERLRHPEASRHEARAYERLLACLGRGVIVLPDEEARAFLAAATVAYDEAVEYAKVKADHDALYALLELLEGGAQRCPAQR